MQRIITDTYHMPSGQTHGGDGPPRSAPVVIRVAPYGRWVHPRAGAFSIDMVKARQMAANHARLGVDVPVDYEHQTLAGAKAPAAGWVRALEVRDDGLYAQVEWNDEARRMIEAKEYRYYSPVFDFDGRDPHTGQPIGAVLHSVGLTNTPLLAHDIQPLAAKRTGAQPPSAGDESHTAQPRAAVLPQKEKRIMDLKEIAALLGLADHADEEQVRQAIVACKAAADAAPPAAAKSVLDALGLAEGASEEDARAKIIALKSPDGMVRRADFEALEAELAQRDAQALVDQAIAACKVTPAQREWAEAYARHDAEGFAKFVECAPKLISAKATAPQAEHGSPALSDAELAVCKQLGIDPAHYAQQLKADNAA